MKMMITMTRRMMKMITGDGEAAVIVNPGAAHAGVLVE